MTDPQNPYEAPSSDLVVDQDFVDGSLRDIPRKLAAGRGLAWIGEAWGYFKQSPLNWILMFLILVALMFLLSLIPFLGPLVTNLIMPALLAGFMLSCRDLDGGKKLTVERLFGAFSLPQRNRFFILGGLYIGATLGIVLLIMLIMLLGFGISGMQAGFGDAPAPEDFMGSGGPATLLAILIAMLLIIPVLMAFYFAPALILFHDLDVVSALKRSFTGCLRNILPFLLFGIAMFFLSILAMIPLMLGFLVLSPIAMITIYVAYREIFLEA